MVLQDEASKQVGIMVNLELDHPIKILYSWAWTQIQHGYNVTDLQTFEENIIFFQKAQYFLIQLPLIENFLQNKTFSKWRLQSGRVK